ncbi:MAG: hypothetical protein GY711_24755 [bacterium]|nr:hypothetical protein [bacterium]
MTVSRILIALALATTAAAQTYSVTGPGGLVPPNGSMSTGGTYPDLIPTDNFFSSTLVLPDGASTIDSVKLTGLSHTYAGDLTIVLYDPSGVGHVVVNRVCSSCDYDGDFEIVESGAPNVFDPIDAGCVGMMIPSGVYDQFFGANCGQWTDGSDGVFNTPMSGIPVVDGGTYELRIFDWLGGDMGSLVEWGLCGQVSCPIPATTPFAADGPGGLVPPIGTASAGGTYPTLTPTGNFFSSTLVLPTTAETIDAVKLNDFGHTWASDVTVVLYAPDGTGHVLINRVCTSCNFGADYEIVESGAPNTFDAFDTICVGDTVIDGGVYDQFFGLASCGSWTDGSDNVFNTPLSAVPVTPGGTYELRIFDWGGGDAGALAGWELCGTGGLVGTSYCGPAVPNAAGESGKIYAAGSALVLANDVCLNVICLPPGEFGFFLAGPGTGTFAPPASCGVFCLGGGDTGLLGRFNAPNQVFVVAPDGTGSLCIDLTAIPIAGVGPDGPFTYAIQPGDTWNFQSWYRDSGCPVNNNFTDAVTVLFE